MIIKKFKTKIFSKESIVDIEICNDISNGPGMDWSYSKSDIITVGLIYKDDVTIIQKEKKDTKKDFINAIKIILPPLGFYAFNYKMEQEGLLGYTHQMYNAEEIKPWKGRGWNKDKFFEEVKTIIKPIDTINDPLNGDSSLVQSRFEDGIYEDIILHNLNCLIKEAYILKFRPALIKKYKNKINSDGWLKE